MQKASFLTKIVGLIHTISPFMRKMMWKFSYNFINKNFSHSEFRFLNYGYLPLSGENVPKLDKVDEGDRDFISLYHHVVSRIEMQNKDVVEIGSGRGGGSFYISKYLQPRSYTGVDFSSQAIEYCRKNYRMNGLLYVHGDAENIPLQSDAYDAVVNVESSHCYGSMKKFVEEVYRILKPGGYFAWADLIDAKKINEQREILERAGFTVQAEENITTRVLQSLDQTHDRKSKAISSYVPRLLKPAMKDFAGMKNTVVYDMFKSGELQYMHFVLQK